jgi:hypothetical protein
MKTGGSLKDAEAFRSLKLVTTSSAVEWDRLTLWINRNE